MGKLDQLVHKRGFTIVELLIVIVVIGILAAITIVAYNGIQTRAENTKTIQAVAQYVKAIRAYAGTYGNYPVTTVYPCLGPVGTSCARLSGDGVDCGLSEGGATAQAAFNTELGKILSGSLPQLSTQTLACGSSTYGGAYYTPSTGTTAEIYYFLKGDQACGGIGGVASFIKNPKTTLTRCYAALPTLP
jgi:prepilin-type N-terminal cleavage/methylation domain-containing protein